MKRLANTSVKHCVIFDLDGTIANCDHRLGFLREQPKNWLAFDAATKHDQTYEEILHILHMYNRERICIVIVTARSENARIDTEWWLKNIAGANYDKIYMRKYNDYREDDIVKKEILHQLRKDGYEPFIVFEDRDSVVKMWRDEGITCCQVREGNY